MQHTEIETNTKETKAFKSKVQASGVLESVIALLIVIYALPVSAVLVKGTLAILYPPQACEVQKDG